MAKETVYQQQLKDLGVYDPAFDPAIHVLCIQERELSRAMKAWKSTVPKNEAPSITDPIYVEISKLRRDILARQDELRRPRCQLRSGVFFMLLSLPAASKMPLHPRWEYSVPGLCGAWSLLPHRR